MKKSAHILKSYSLVKFANEYNEFGQQNPYLAGPTGFDVTMTAGIPAAIATPMAVQSYNTLRAANPAVAPSFGQVASQTARRFGGAAPVAGTAAKGFGRFLGPAGIALATGYAAKGVYDATGNMNRGYQQSGFSNQPGGFANYLGTTEGLNRVADTVQGGSLTLAGTALGAGIGAFAGGIGAIPGALIGGTIGGIAELGMGGYRKATGWDGAKFDEAKNLYKGNVDQNQAIGMVYNSLQNPNKKMFESKGLFGKRDLGAEAFADVQKENDFIKNKDNSFQENLS
jgi:hypothetical protein